MGDDGIDDTIPAQHGGKELCSARQLVEVYVENSRERSLALTKIDEALMWLRRCHNRAPQDDITSET